MHRTKSLLFALTRLAVPALALANERVYEVTVTNVTKGTLFTPLLVVTHDADISLFTPGEPALEELATLAESGATVPLQTLLDGLTDVVSETTTGGGPIMPGNTMSIEIGAGSPHDVLSFAGMLLPTNDTFVAADSLALPRGRFDTVTTFVYAWDAG